ILNLVLLLGLADRSKHGRIEPEIDFDGPVFGQFGRMLADPGGGGLGINPSNAALFVQGNHDWHPVPVGFAHNLFQSAQPAFNRHGSTFLSGWRAGTTSISKMYSFSGTSPNTEHGAGSVASVWPSANLVTTDTRPCRWTHAGQLRSSSVRSKRSRR